MLLLILFLSMLPALARGQPVPLPHTGQPGTIYGPQGQRYETFETPSGSVTYDDQGRSWRTSSTPDGGSVTYDERGQSWRVYPSPSSRSPVGDSPPQ